MMETVYLLGIGIVIVVYTVMKWSNRKLRHIPGPTPLPIIGNVHQIDAARPYITFTNWVKEYGDVFAIRLFNQDTVVINSPEIAQEVLITKGAAFAGRPVTYRSGVILYDHKDIGFQTYTPRLVYLRKITHTVLKSYGVGMARLEDIIHKAVNESLDDMASHMDKPFSPEVIITKVLCNIMTTVLIGKEFKSSDSDVATVGKLDHLVSEVLNPAEGAELDTFPWLRFFGNTCFKKMQETVKFRDEFMNKQFDSLKKTMDPDNIRGVFDAFFLQQQQANDDNERLNDTEIKAVIHDLIIGGTNTTTSSINIAILLLINYPDIQKRLTQEIDQVLGNRFPRNDDRSFMPYTEAFILEVLRYGSQLPLLLPHFTMKDTTLAGFPIPKDTQVLINAYSIHHDERFYEDPWSVKPERFLDDDGNLVPADHPARRNFFLFGAGRRVCLGENFAKARLFLFFVALIQRFEVLPVDGETPPSVDPKGYNAGLVLFPKPYRIRLVERK